MATKPSVNEKDMFIAIMSYKYDPIGFVMFAFPWGQPNTPLAKIKQPRTWQLEEFARIQQHMADNRARMALGLNPEPIYLAISSGRGPGKSAFLAMLNMWFMSCWVGGTGIVTANTETQLRSRTMAELGKWHSMSINRHWFDKSSMTLRPQGWFSEMLKEQLSMDTQYYYVDGQSWSADNPDAFAGAHSQIGMLVQFDEASGIDDPIWNVTEGFFTDLAEFRMWVAISNPRRNTGRFFECFHKDSEYWQTRYIDSRKVEGVDPSVYQRIADKYGEDHDVTRVEVKGEFPRTGSAQFIGRELVNDAVTRELGEQEVEVPLLMGVDVARYGDDESVIRWRKGRDGRSIRPSRFKGMNTMDLATECARMIDEKKPDAVFVDGGGVGGGVVDRLRQLGYRVIEVQAGERPREPDKFLNLRAQMWHDMREWMVVGCIEDDERLVEDLTNPEYEIALKGQLKIEGKADMKKRGLASTDDADALALTFAYPVSYRQASRKPLRETRSVVSLSGNFSSYSGAGWMS